MIVLSAFLASDVNIVRLQLFPHPIHLNPLLLFYRKVSIDLTLFALPPTIIRLS